MDARDLASPIFDGNVPLSQVLAEIKVTRKSRSNKEAGIGPLTM